MNKTKLNQLTINNIYEDFKISDDIFNNESDKLTKVKNIIFNKLSEPDRRLLLLYVELGTLRAVAELIGVSISTVSIKINQIKKIILDNYYGNIS